MPIRFLLTFTAILATAVIAGCLSKEVSAPQRPPARSVGRHRAAADDSLRAELCGADGELAPEAIVAARVSGFLDKIAYKEGELVKDGQLLFQLDPKPFQAQLDAARGELQAQQARFTTAQATLARVKPLAQQNALSQADLDKAQGEYDAAKAAVYSAQAKVKEAELNLGYATIRSPVTGLASRSAQREGAYLNAQAPDSKLTYVAAIDPIWVTFSISQNQTAAWREMREKKQVVFPKDQDFDGRDRSLGRIALPAYGHDQLRRPLVQPGHRIVRGARGPAQPEADAAAGHVRHRLREGSGAPGCDRRAAARGPARIETQT